MFFLMLALFFKANIVSVLKDKNVRISVAFYLVVGYLSGMIVDQDYLYKKIMIEAFILFISVFYAAYLKRKTN